MPSSAPTGDSSATRAHGRTIAVIGLGYVGLPVAVSFGRAGTPTIGFDINPVRIAELSNGHDRTCEVADADLAAARIRFTADPAQLREADFFIVTVPTPIDAAKRPDLTALRKASETVGRAMPRGAIVVYESTVFPGATEEFCVPILEAASGLACGRDFTVGYSPERINPGDKEHRFETIRKVVSGQDAETLATVAAVYGSVVTAGVFQASSIKVAEAAKVIENTQRDLNIALMNELSEIFHLLDIDTSDVLAAAGTKWNFLRFTPGLVGGHCIGVDPYYLTHRAEIAGYHPEVILAGRRVNDRVGTRIAQECVRRLMRSGIANGRVVVLGLTFKEDVPDIRNSKVVDVIAGLEAAGLEVLVHDPHADPDEVRHEYGLTLAPADVLRDADAVVFAVAHAQFLADPWALAGSCLKNGRGIVFDVKARLDRRGKPEGIDLWRL
ncbi:nucleotide sugar dehydrogenase [Rhodoplanes azumiensis]|uniref:Nucleotide sugar dehydrogenase n=1 Tax=Rhodoplanes azumiensis TaxID=1897628 RepID=A0ABW5AIY1_9BRAD